MTTERELGEDGARRGGMANGQCSKGWGKRCAASKGRSCRCACGGVNHGKAHSHVPAAGGDNGVVIDEGNRHSRFSIVGAETDNDKVTIRDLGPWDYHLSVTNDAEWVVQKMKTLGLASRRLFYYDSVGQLDELVHADGRFVRFAPGHQRREAVEQAFAGAGL